MAARRTGTAAAHAVRRVNSNHRADQVKVYRIRGGFEDGSAVRVLEEEPEEQLRPRKKPQVSDRTKRNRERATSMSAGYVIFLSVVCAAVVFLCIHYLQLRSELINQSETIAVMQSALSKLEADNDAYYKQAMASVTMEDVKDTALNKLGMHYASESQIRYYDASNESYVRQYESVPAG